MTTNLEAIPYVLPRPIATTPVIPEYLLNTHFANSGDSRYGDAIWWVAPLTSGPSKERIRIAWASCPDGLREELRLLVWTFLNGELKHTFVRQRGTRMRTRVSRATARQTISTWFRFSRWLSERNVHTLAACDRAVLHEYAIMLREGANDRAYVHHQLTALTRLWAFDQLTAQSVGIARPPWDEDGFDDYLPAAGGGGGENKREALAEETMGPLLIWAIRVVEDLADDILAAYDEFRRLTEVAPTQPSTPAGRTALKYFLGPMAAAGGPIPATRKCGKTAFARTYIAGVTGASLHQVQSFYKDHCLAPMVAARPGPCPLSTHITGRIAGHPWREAIDYNEAIALRKHLVAAAFIVCAYLTGARPQEVLGMRSGCCPEPSQDGNPGRHLIRIHPEDVADDPEEDGNDGDETEDASEPHLLIRSHHFKTATDPDSGNYRPAERPVPWVAITPVVNAIRVLERIVPEGELLFGSAMHNPSYAHLRTGALGQLAVRERIDEFVAWVNVEATAQGLPGEVIPPDPYGGLGLARFRRTLAWHIARRPGGLVALAIQYGHMRTALDRDESGRYGSRSRRGIHDLVDVETALATADAAADLHERFQDGEGVSGPAARRALLEASTGPLFRGALVKSDFARKHALARRHLARDGGVLYDNPHALLLCLYKRDRALCEQHGQHDAPSLERCVAGCGNTVRTDQHAALLRERASHLERKAARLPGPIGDRLRRNAGKLRSWADEHDRTRFTRQETTA